MSCCWWWSVVLRGIQPLLWGYTAKVNQPKAPFILGCLGKRSKAVQGKGTEDGTAWPPFDYWNLYIVMPFHCNVWLFIRSNNLTKTFLVELLNSDKSDEKRKENCWKALKSSFISFVLYKGR